MGLDNFRSDNENETTTDTDGKIKEESKNVEENTEQSGLMSFKTDDSSTSSSSSSDSGGKDRPPANPWINDFTSTEWNNMSTENKVQYVRDNYYPGYRPSIGLDKDWSSRLVVEVDCECENTFTFQSDGICMDCGRTYMLSNGVVVKKDDPHIGNEGDMNE